MTPQESCDLSGECRTTHSPFAYLNTAHCCFQSHATHRFRFSCCLHFPGISVCSEKYITVVSHRYWFVMHFTDTNGTVYTRNTYFNTVAANSDWLCVCTPCQSKKTATGLFADTHGLTRYEPTLTNNQNVVAWTEDENPHRVQVGHGPITSNPPWRSVHNFTEEENGHIFWHLLAEQHVYFFELSTYGLRKAGQ